MDLPIVVIDLGARFWLKCWHASKRHNPDENAQLLGFRLALRIATFSECTARRRTTRRRPAVRRPRPNRSRLDDEASHARRLAGDYSLAKVGLGAAVWRLRGRDKQGRR